MQHRVWVWIALSLVLLVTTLHATEVEVAGPTTVTPANTFAHYNTTGATIGSYLYLYHQGQGDISDTSCPNGDKIIAYRAPITNGVPGAFERVGRISPCAFSPSCIPSATVVCSPTWPMASYGPGQIFQATINGVTKWHLLADASNTADFHNVWHGESTDGINWSWAISDSVHNSNHTETVQEGVGHPGGDVVSHTIVSTVLANPFLHATNLLLLNPIMLSTNPTGNNADWWGFVNTSSGVTALKVSWSTGSPVVSVLTNTSPSWNYLIATNGNFDTLSNPPVFPLTGTNVKTLIQEPPGSGQYQLWGSLAQTASPAYGSSVDCTTSNLATCTLPGTCETGDGSFVANGFTGRAFYWNTGPAGDVGCSNCSSTLAWWPATSASLGATNPVLSQVRSMPSGYEIARLFPFRWDSPTGNRYLFSATNDNHICNEFLFSGFFKMYVTQTTVASLSDSCTPSSTKLCLQSGRFEVAADFVNGGTTQAAATKTYSDKSAFFTFFDPSNPEIGVKILDGRPVNGKWWFFHGAVTSLQYTVRVTDTVNHVLRTYTHPAATTSALCGGADTGAFSLRAASLAAPASDAGAVLELPESAPRGSFAAKSVCVPSSTRLCLLSSRFQVELTKSGVKQGAAQLADPSGVFWFSDSTTAEVPVKVIDGRAVNSKFWVFFGSMTDQAYSLVVTDTTTGVVKTYTPSASFCGTADTSAF